MDLTNFKPLLAGTVTDLEKLKFPLIASPKLDGIRCVIVNGKVLSRNLKPIPNKYIREKLESLHSQENFDGEIIIPNADFNTVQSLVMSFEGEPDFKYMVFDIIDNRPYSDRICPCIDNWRKIKEDFLEQLDNVEVNNLAELIALEDQWVKEGYEGIMLRDPNGRYKFGRSTEKEGILLKLKRFFDAECVVIGFEEKMKNNNEQTKDAMGYSVRSSEKAGMIPAETLGALIVSDCDTFNEFRIGSGFNDEQRLDIWNNKENYLKKIVTYKYQEISKYNIPRFPVFKHFRTEE